MASALLQPLFPSTYFEVPNRRADRNKQAGLGKIRLINEHCGIFRLLHEKLRPGWKEV